MGCTTNNAVDDDDGMDTRLRWLRPLPLVDKPWLGRCRRTSLLKGPTSRGGDSPFNDTALASNDAATMSSSSCDSDSGADGEKHGIRHWNEPPPAPPPPLPPLSALPSSTDERPPPRDAMGDSV